MQDLSSVSIVFDLDGTLVDSAPDLAGAMNAVLRAHGRREVPAEKVRSMVGHGARALMARGFAETGAPADDALLDRLYDEFLEYYLAHIADESVLFPGVREVTEALRQKGARLAVCTNKPEKAAIDLLDALEFSAPFDALVGGDTLAVRKPDAEAFRETLRRMQARERDRGVMVGDSETDVLTGRAAGVPVIGVTFGYTPQPIATFSPDVIIDHFADFPQALAAILRIEPACR